MISDEAIEWGDDSEYQSKLNPKLELHSYDVNDFHCPILMEKNNSDPIVNHKYCDSFSFGTGCRHKKECEAYNNKESISSESREEE